MRNVKTPRFQARHYEAIAETLSKLAEDPGIADRNYWVMWRATVAAYVAMFEADNPKFSPDKFRKACGIES